VAAHYKEKFEDTKGEIRSRKSLKDRQYNGQNKNDNTLHRKLKRAQHEPYLIYIYIYLDMQQSKQLNEYYPIYRL